MASAYGCSEVAKCINFFLQMIHTKVLAALKNEQLLEVTYLARGQGTQNKFISTCRGFHGNSLTLCFLPPSFFHLLLIYAANIFSHADSFPFSHIFYLLKVTEVL